ncbi:DNA/RNA non-specific endonuclease [Actinomadura bangladeshensis]
MRLMDTASFPALERWSYIYVKFCSDQQLEGGSDSRTPYEPPGWPKKNSLGDGSRQHKWAKCHLRANSLGGDGRYDNREQNLFTCLQEPTDNSYMGYWEEKMKGAVEGNKQIVDYRVTLIYRGRQKRPIEIHMRGSRVYRNGMPSQLYFDRCITTRANGTDRQNKNGSC